ncbi:MAG: diguanylate cyclase [Chloroflexi bacterium]|nr:diguanylate cyclase [Chloroflexota bacterium]
MPRRAWIYICFIFLSGITATLLAALDFSAAPDLYFSSQWYTLTALIVLATLAQLFKAEAPDHQIYHTTLVFQFAGVVLLHPFLFVFLILIPHLAEWVRERLIIVDSPHLRDWYLQPFNISLHIIIGGLTHLVFTQLSLALGSLEGAGELITAVIAALLYVALNHLIVGMALVFARGVSLRESGIMEVGSLITDLVTLLMGYAMAVVWEINFWLIWVALAPLILIYRALSIPILERQAQMDAKTEVWNAGYFKEAMQTELSRAQELNRPMALAMADLDLLRHINNTYGHLAGDAVLQGIAKILRESAHTYDIVARFGGEEFAILMPETTTKQAYERVETMRRTIEAADFIVDTNDEPIKATMSFGIAAKLDNQQSATKLVHNADIAVYQAKENGRNRTHLYHYKRDSHIHIPNAASERPQMEPVSVNVSAEASLPNTRVSIDETPTPIASPVEEEEFQPMETSLKAARQTNAYIGAVVLLAVVLASFAVRFKGDDIDWLGILTFTLLTLIVEALSVEIHVRDTAVSTSVAPYLASILLFGPVAILIAPLIALVNQIKRRGPITRTLFNASNHIIGSLLPAGIILLSGETFTTLSMPIQALGSIVIISFNYFITTTLLAGAISISSNQPFIRVWSERFRWLASYYFALGFVVFALIFSYLVAGIMGILVILVPLLMLRFSQKQYIDHTEDLVAQLRANNKELRVQSDEITLLDEELLLTLARSIDLRDPYVMEHAKNVARYAVLIAEELGLSRERIEDIRKASLLHDIGKLGVPETILFKPTKLTNNEYELIKNHVNIGADLIYGCHSFHNLIPFVQRHHERFDGKGYPDGLAGEEIPLEARILSLADAVEAMASDRPYKVAESPETILAEVTRCAGGQFDPMIVAAFKRILEKRGYSVIINSARNVEGGKYASVKVLT